MEVGGGGLVVTGGTTRVHLSLRVVLSAAGGCVPASPFPPCPESKLAYLKASAMAIKPAFAVVTHMVLLCLWWLQF